MRKILVLRGGALGDFIVTLPALASLRRAWPTARIELAGNATAAIVARHSGLLDAVHSQHEARWSVLFGAAPLPPEFSAWLASFDLVVNFWPDRDGTLARHFPLRTEQKFLSAPALPTVAPAAAHFCAALAPLGIATRDFHFSLAPQSRPDLKPSPLIALHPGSGSPGKNWPLERWAVLCDWLRHDQHAELLVITGEAESPDTRALARFGTSVHARPLDELADHFSRCRLFIGHDSGISHLAAAWSVPCVLLFGPTDPAMWAPPAPRVHVIRRGHEMNAISVKDVQCEVAACIHAQTSAS